MEKKIKDMIIGCGADVCGIAAAGAFTEAPAGFSPKDIYADCQSVIVFGKALPKGLGEVPSRLVYGHFNYLCCPQLDRIALEAANLLESGFQALAVPLPSDGPYEYWDKEKLTGRGLLSMKHAAVLAGLGQLGKSTLLLNPQYGNRLVIGAILTNLPLKSDLPCEKICIDGCTKCIDACPVQAISDGSVHQWLCRPNSYKKNARGFDTVNCNKCRMVCPRRWGI